MTPKDHAKIIGISFLILGFVMFIITVGCVIMFFLFGGFESLKTDYIGLIPIEFIMGIYTLVISIVMIVLFIIFVIPSIIAGWNLFKGNGKGKILTVIAVIFYILQFPYGTAIGVYALWFIFGGEGKKYFRN